jgi:two-component system phosphate regulon sensor histidine kinase PhoR
VTVSGTSLHAQLASLADAARSSDLVLLILAVLGLFLVIHLALDVFVLRRRRRRRESIAQESRMAAAADLSAALARARDSEEVGRVLLDTLNELIGTDHSGLMLIDEGGTEARGLIARSDGVDLDWYPAARVDLKSEVSGVRCAYETRTLFLVENALDSPEVNAELIERAGLKSVAFLPLESERRMIGVVSIGSTTGFLSFTSEQLALMNMLAAEGTLALERTYSLAALERALERERLVSEISRRVRSESDVDRLIEVALAETAEALGASRCFLRLGDPETPAPLRLEWRQEGLDPIPADATPYLSVSNLALRQGRTAAVADIETSPELADESLGGREALLGLGSRAVLSAPIVLFGAVIGVLAVHASAVRDWSDDDIAFIEAVAREFGMALYSANLLEENRRRLEQQEGLLAATEAMAGELELDSVLTRRLAGGRADLFRALSTRDVLAESVSQAIALLDADAALLLELEGSELVAREGSSYGLEEMQGERFPAAISMAGDLVYSRRPLVIGDLSLQERLETLDPIVREGFQALLGVPLIGSDDSLEGVLIVYSHAARAWRAKETEALVSLAANTATALANAFLYLRVSFEREQSIAILSSVADGIVAVDREGKIVLWNAAVERSTGISSDEALGRTSVEVLRRELDSGAEQGERSISIKRGGTELWLEVTEATMRDPADQIAGKIYTLRDVSTDRFVEQAKSDFVSSVSHELRAPLTSIYGFAETLLRRGELFDETQRRTFLSYIASESERLTGIVDALLDVAELDSGDLQVELGQTDVAHIVREVVEVARQGESGSNGHEFVIDLGADESLGAEADRDKLRRVLVNLIDNAIKFSPDGGKVTVAGQKRPGVVELRVVDEGVGIPAEEQERIFRKFYRGSPSVLRGGTGLGLFISRGLVTAMGGRIWVNSVEGEGSSFVLELVSSEAAGAKSELPSVGE